MRFEKTKEADEDLIEIYLYSFTEFGKEQAEKYYSELEKVFQTLADTPYICRERDEFAPPVRIHHHGRHLVVYVIKESHILIIRVLHDKMDIEGHLPN